MTSMCKLRSVVTWILPETYYQGRLVTTGSPYESTRFKDWKSELYCKSLMHCSLWSKFELGSLRVSVISTKSRKGKFAILYQTTMRAFNLTGLPSLSLFTTAMNGRIFSKLIPHTFSPMMSPNGKYLHIRTSVHLSISYTHTFTKAAQPEPLKSGSFKILDNELEHPGASNTHRDAWTWLNS